MIKNKLIILSLHVTITSTYFSILKMYDFFIVNTIKKLRT